MRYDSPGIFNVSALELVLKKQLFFKWNSITLKNGPKMHVKSKIITISINQVLILI